MKDGRKVQSNSAWVRHVKSDCPRKLRSKGFTLIELLVFLWLMVCGVFGFSRGIRFASQYGPGWALLGAVLGFALGMIAGIVLLALIVLIFESLGKFCKWWRPSLPPCASGCCYQKDYKTVATPLSVRKSIEGVPDYTYRCKCGHLYIKISTMALKTKWGRLLSDNRIQPYLKHYPFGRWKAEKADNTEISMEGNKRDWDIDFCSTKTLKPYQEALVPFFVIFIILSFSLLLMFLLFPLSSGGMTISLKEYMLYFTILPSVLALEIGIYMVICIEGNSIVRIIEADSELIRIHRFGKRQLEIPWGNIIFSTLKKELNSRRWIFKTADKKYIIASEGFPKEQWELLSDYIQQNTLPDD